MKSQLITKTTIQLNFLGGTIGFDQRYIPCILIVNPMFYNVPWQLTDNRKSSAWKLQLICLTITSSSQIKNKHKKYKDNYRTFCTAANMTNKLEQQKFRG